MGCRDGFREALASDATDLVVAEDASCRDRKARRLGELARFFQSSGNLRLTALAPDATDPVVAEDASRWDRAARGLGEHFF